MNNHENLQGLLHEMLIEFVENEQFPGLAVGIVKDNQVLFTGEYGTANVSTSDQVVRSTLFHQASVSKTFVATAIMQLVERGEVELDSPITQYLSYFKMEDERYRKITIRQLMNHTSGMPDEEDYAWDRPEYDEHSLERYVKIISHHKLLSDPGDVFAYSNIGYEILGDMIAKVSGLSFEQYMNKNILEPTGMRSSSYLKQEVDAHLAAPHVLGTSDGYGGYISHVFPYNRAHGPSSTLYTNAEDMCQYLLMHQNGGIAGNGHEILQSISYNEMWKPHAKTGYWPENAQIGLGWFLGEYKGSRVISHTGWDTGFLSNLYVLPDEKISISIMTNCDYVWLESVSFPILDLLLGTNIHHIKQSIAHKVAAIAVSDGVDQAMAEYHRIMSTEQDKHYLMEHEFMRITEALTWSGDKEDAVCILKCASTIFPNNSSISSRLEELYNIGGRK
jgi:CubicO group peptidase (beta-lactamase class C family)